MISMKTSGSKNMAQIWNKSEVIILYKRFSFQGIYLWPCFWDAIYVEIQKQKSKNSWTTQIKKRNFQNTSPATGKYPNPVLNCKNGTQHIIELDFWFEIHCAPICQRGFHKLQPVNHTFSWCQYDITVLFKKNTFNGNKFFKSVVPSFGFTSHSTQLMRQKYCISLTLDSSIACTEL